MPKDILQVGPLHRGRITAVDGTGIGCRRYYICAVRCVINAILGSSQRSCLGLKAEGILSGWRDCDRLEYVGPARGRDVDGIKICSGPSNATITHPAACKTNTGRLIAGYIAAEIQHIAWRVGGPLSRAASGNRSQVRATNDRIRSAPIGTERDGIARRTRRWDGELLAPCVTILE
jgi:hypothetical protein